MDKEAAAQMLEEIIKMQRYISAFTERTRPGTIEDLVTHLSRVRSCLEKLM